MTSKINLQLDVFEGPLDLLLYLIKKNDLEISRISIAQVTQQYLDYLDGFTDIDIDFVSDYLYMAAELAHLKSITLLPNDKKAGDETSEDDDFANNLLQRLREYEKYKRISQHLKDKHWLNRDVFSGQSIDYTAQEETQKTPEKIVRKISGDVDIDFYDLMRAFYQALARVERGGREHNVMTDHYSVADRIYQILDTIKDLESCLFEDLFANDKSRADVVITFLAILEMGKHRMLEIFQTDAFGSIRIRKKIEMDQDIKPETVKKVEDWNDYK